MLEPASKTLGRVAGTALFLLGAVCAQAKEHDSRPPADRMPQAGEGTVLVSITSNITVLRQFDSLHVEQQVVADPSGKAPKPDGWRLSQVSRGMARDTALFAGVLPAGDYQITQVADDESMKYVTFAEGAKQMLGSFHVEAGATSDLGRLIITPLNDKVLIGRSPSITDNASAVRALSPDNGMALEGEVLHGWMSDRNPKDFAEELALHEPIGVTRFVELESGIVGGAAKMGSIVWRSPQGQWRSKHVAGLESLLCVTRATAPGELLVAAGEMNTLVGVNAQGVARRLDAGDLPMGSIVYLDGSEAAGWWLVHERGAQSTVYHSARLDAGHWEVVRTETTKPSGWAGPRLAYVWPASGGLLYATSDGPLHFLDFATGVWTDRPLPAGSHIVDLRPGAPGSFGILLSGKSGLAGVFADSYITRDNAITWTKVEPPKKVRAMAPVPMAGDVIVQESIAIGFSHQSQVFQASRDNGKTWTTVPADLPPNSVLYPVGSTGLLGVADYPDSIEQVWFAQDPTAAWKLELTNWIQAPKPAS